MNTLQWKHCFQGQQTIILTRENLVHYFYHLTSFQLQYPEMIWRNQWRMLPLTVHVAVLGLQAPPVEQVILLDPVSLYPLLHSSVNVVPTWWGPLTSEIIRPLNGAVGVGQVVAAAKVAKKQYNFNACYLHPYHQICTHSGWRGQLLPIIHYYQMQHPRDDPCYHYCSLFAGFINGLIIPTHYNAIGASFDLFSINGYW